MNPEERLRQKLMKVLEESDSNEDISDQESSGEEEEDHVSERSHQSDTEQEASSSDDDNIPLSMLQNQARPTLQLESRPESPTSRESQLPHYIGKDGTVWYKAPFRQNIRIRAENIVTQRSGPTSTAQSAMTALDCWSLFCTEDMLQNILTYTNARIRPKIASCQNLSKYTHIKECSMAELKAFIGLLYIAGLHRSGRQNLSDLWATDGTGVEIFGLVMSLQRFHFIQACLTFDDISTREERKAQDNLAPVREMFDIFVDNCKKNFVPGECLTIDEMLIAFRGRCKFRQYIPSKPAKYGIKIIAMVDSDNFYIKNLEIYPGTQPDGPYSQSNKPFDVVDRIIQPISHTNRNVTFDNWFSSYEIVQHLLQQHKLTSVGTLRKNKRQIPLEFTKTRGMEVYASRFGFQKDCTLVAHVPKKNKVVLLISSLHHNDAIDDSTGAKRKPEINTYYNYTKCGVDVADELCATYDVNRNSKRWPLTIFYAVLNMAAINALIIHRINNNSNIKRRRFLKTLGLALVGDHMKKRKDVVQLPREMRKRIGQFVGECSVEPPAKKINVRKRCQVCPAKKDRKTTHMCKKCNKFICPEHVVPLCSDCFDNDESD